MNAYKLHNNNKRESGKKDLKKKERKKDLCGIINPSINIDCDNVSHLWITTEVSFPLERTLSVCAIILYTQNKTKHKMKY